MRIYKYYGTPEKPDTHIIDTFDETNKNYVKMEQEEW